MTHSRAARATSRRTRARRARFAPVSPVARSAQRAVAALRRAPLLIQILSGAVAVLAIWAALNGLYQVIRKPTELFFPVSGTPRRRLPRHGGSTRHSSASTPPRW